MFAEFKKFAMRGNVLDLAVGVIIGASFTGIVNSLVKDIITGLFILFEDSISVGDVVDVGGGHSGVCEAISIRSITIW